MNSLSGQRLNDFALIRGKGAYCAEACDIRAIQQARGAGSDAAQSHDRQWSIPREGLERRNAHIVRIRMTGGRKYRAEKSNMGARGCGALQLILVVARRG